MQGLWRRSRRRSSPGSPVREVLAARASAPDFGAGAGLAAEEGEVRTGLGLRNGTSLTGIEGESGAQVIKLVPSTIASLEGQRLVAQRTVTTFFVVVIEQDLFDNLTVGEIFHDLNQTGVKFLLLDLDLAMTFMDGAEASRLEDTKHRNHENARKAYDSVVRLLENLKPDAGQRRAFDAKLARLKTRLETIGQQF
jgi:hypothetical protein